jgi:hypothetical protein
MSRWFRHYAGMMRDDKLVRVAIRSGQTIERVVWVWGAILESASEIDDGGTFDLDASEIAYFLRADEADIDSIIRGLEAAGRLAGSTVAKWGDRQFSSDRSKERQAAYRERKKTGQERQPRVPLPDNAGDSDAGVTSPSRHGDAPETETELDTEETPIVPLEGGRSGKTLIPADWKPPLVSELPPRSRACAEQWTDASYQTEAEAFACYWRSERKMKANWRDTWCNRIVARHEAVMRAQKFGNAAPTSLPKSKGPMTTSELENAIRFRRDMGDEERAAEYEAELAERRAA